MVATKIFKKCSPHGRLYLYLGQRDYISSDGVISDVKGIACVPEQHELKGEIIRTIDESNTVFLKLNNVFDFKTDLYIVFVKRCSNVYKIFPHKIVNFKCNCEGIPDLRPGQYTWSLLTAVC